MTIPCVGDNFLGLISMGPHWEIHPCSKNFQDDGSWFWPLVYVGVTPISPERKWSMFITVYSCFGIPIWAAQSPLRGVPEGKQTHTLNPQLSVSFLFCWGGHNGEWVLPPKGQVVISQPYIHCKVRWRGDWIVVSRVANDLAKLVWIWTLGP